MIGYVGAGLVALSYLLPLRWLLVSSGLGSIFLTVYAVQTDTTPFVVLNLFCLGVILVRLARR